MFGVRAEIGLLLLIVYTPTGNTAFGTAPLAWAPWALMAGLAVLFGLLEEFRKWLVRRAQPVV